VLRGANNRPLKSLSDTLKGKQGRFRQNLLGKRVDYSGRSVIVVGRSSSSTSAACRRRWRSSCSSRSSTTSSKSGSSSATIKQAKELVEQQRPEVWDILEEVIREHPVLLNRAPTLHRLGIQAFEPVLVEGKAIRIHPLVCTAFNADFDGDQMAVHIPLSPEAQIEASVLMMSSNNILSPSNGAPIAVPSQDIVLGCYYMTKAKSGAKGEGAPSATSTTCCWRSRPESSRRCRPSVCASAAAAGPDDGARQPGHPAHRVAGVKSKIINTTVGRVLLNEQLPKEMPFVNGLLKKKGLQQLVQKCYLDLGLERTVEMLDALKHLGFTYATRSGLSIGIDDLVIPANKAQLVSDARREVIKVEQQYLEGAITNGERYNKIIAVWSEVTEKVADEMFGEMAELDRTGRSFNPVYIMADSGARGSKQQIRQLAGMRGLMAKPSGEIIEAPITSNFREGLTVQQYFISTHGARKGLADTALKTADSGYLTRRLVDVAQDVIISEDDCGTLDGIEARAIVESGEIIEPLRDRIVGRVTLERIADPFTNESIVDINGEIDEDKASDIQEAGIEKVRIRSVLTCAARRGVCKRCYGRDLATGRLVELGQAVGVIAAQSIGEPGTQLTMRTFHIGGTASRVSEQNTLDARHAGNARYEGLQVVETHKGRPTAQLIVMNRSGSLVVADNKGRDRERYPIVYGARLKVRDGQKVEQGQVLVEWDPYTFSILTEEPGIAKFKDIIDGLTVHEEVDEVTGLSRFIIVDSPDEKKQPTIEIKDKAGKVLRKYHMPSHAHLMVQDGESVEAGDVLAKIPRETTKTKDITGGLPRVVELFEARKPKDPAVISEIDGIVKDGGVVKGQRKLIIIPDDGTEPREYALPRGVHVNVHEGERVRAGEQLMDGPSNPHDILRVLGEKELQKYLVNEFPECLPHLLGVNINDKHIECDSRQNDALGPGRGTSRRQPNFPRRRAGGQRFRFMEENPGGGGVIGHGEPPGHQRSRCLLAITKASLSTESFQNQRGRRFQEKNHGASSPQAAIFRVRSTTCAA
jgi:DNA-directed RNA polymerase subunit beta'